MIHLSRLQRVRRLSTLAAAAAVAALFGGVGGGAVGCGSSGGSSNTDCNGAIIVDGDACALACADKGGVVKGGVCVGKCVDTDPTKGCLENNVCVDNACALVCTTYRDCVIGQQDCLPAKQDGTGADVFVCQTTNKAAFGAACPFGTECAAEGLMVCPNGDQCSLSPCADGSACSPDPIACIGVDNCSQGKCGDNTTACRIPGCGAADCKPMACISKGPGDAEAYCSKQDCTQDSECQSSFYCGVTRDPNPICDQDPTKEKGGGSFCGSTPAMDADPMCIEPTDFSKDGASYFEGGVCLLRHTCIQRKQCDPCQNDAECANLLGGTCAQIGPDMRCTVPCGTDTDCQSDAKCDSRGLCIPRFAGGCVGTGKFCEPCVDDTDCGDKDSSFACVSNSTGQKACFDESFPDVCTTDADCPLSPSGLHGHCFNENDGFTSADALYHHCYQVFDPIVGRYGCW